MLRFQGEEYRDPLSLHTHRKVAHKDPILPPELNPNHTLNTTTRCKHNINFQQHKNSHSNLLYFDKFTF